MQNVVLQDSGQHVTAPLNSCFISDRYLSNLFLEHEDVLELKDIGWLFACYCKGVRKRIAQRMEGVEGSSKR